MKLISFSGTFSNGKTTLMNDVAASLRKDGYTVVTIPMSLTPINDIINFKMSDINTLIDIRNNGTCQDKLNALNYIRAAGAVKRHAWDAKVIRAYMQGKTDNVDIIITDRSILDSVAVIASLTTLLYASDIPPSITDIEQDITRHYSSVNRRFSGCTIIPLTSQVSRPYYDDGKGSDVTPKEFTYLFTVYLDLLWHMTQLDTNVAYQLLETECDQMLPREERVLLAKDIITNASHLLT